jgi:hypothetical protein
VIFPAAGGVAFDISGASGLLGDTGSVTSAWVPSPNPSPGSRATVTALTAINPALGISGNVCQSIRTLADPNALLRAYTVQGTNLPLVPAGNTVYLYQGVQYSVTARPSKMPMTPGCPDALEKSSFRIRAWAYGLRKNATCARRGKRRSSMKAPRPCSNRCAFARGMLWPM